MLADRYFGLPPLHKKANKVLQRWRVLAFYRIAPGLTFEFSDLFSVFDEYGSLNALKQKSKKCPFNTGTGLKSLYNPHRG